jgi:4-alpha-glucanotransferase
MVREGFLKPGDLRGVPPLPAGTVDYPAVSLHKRRLFDRAFDRFEDTGQKHGGDFEAFCADHSGWLDDYALFIALKNHHRGRAWNEWPRPFRDRRPSALREARRGFAREIRREKFL